MCLSHEQRGMTREGAGTHYAIHEIIGTIVELVGVLSLCNFSPSPFFFASAQCLHTSIQKVWCGGKRNVVHCAPKHGCAVLKGPRNAAHSPVFFNTPESNTNFSVNLVQSSGERRDSQRNDIAVFLFLQY